MQLPEHHEVLNHFFAEIVIDTVDFFFGEKCRKMS